MWFLVAFPPLLFLALIVSVSIWVTVHDGGRSENIAARVMALAPHMLMAAELILLAALIATLRAEGLRWTDIGWRFAQGQSATRDVGLGIAVGGALGVLYAFVLSPVLAFVQRALGEAVPPSRDTPDRRLSNPHLLRSERTASRLFVEESLYRGYAIVRLSEQMSSTRAAVVSCVFFGLLHWAGGLWYIVLTGSVAGGVLVAMRLWRGSLIAPFTVHLTHERRRIRSRLEPALKRVASRMNLA